MKLFIFHKISKSTDINFLATLFGVLAERMIKDIMKIFFSGFELYMFMFSNYLLQDPPLYLCYGQDDVLANIYLKKSLKDNNLVLSVLLLEDHSNPLPPTLN